MDVDFWGVVHGTKAFLPHLIASGDGHVVNVSSLFGLIAVPGQAAYNAAKFGVRGFTEALRQEMLVNGHPVVGHLRAPRRHQDRHRPQRRSGRRHRPGGQRASSSTSTWRGPPRRRPPRSSSTAMLAGKPRVLVGTDAKVLDAFVRLTGSGYQRVVALVTGRAMRRR